MIEDGKLERLAAKAAMEKMIRRGWVNICAIRECIQILKLPNYGRALDILATLHCVNFKDMEPELRAEIPNLLAEVFTPDSMNWEPVFSSINRAPNATLIRPSGLLGLLIGGKERSDG